MHGIWGVKNEMPAFSLAWYFLEAAPGPACLPESQEEVVKAVQSVLPQDVVKTVQSSQYPVLQGTAEWLYVMLLAPGCRVQEGAQGRCRLINFLPLYSCL